MNRLFVAIDLPDDAKDTLLNLKTPLDGARWVKPHTLHLTLYFIGDVDDTTMSAIQSALHTVSAAPFSLTLSGVGRFPPSPKKSPRVIWVGVEENLALNALQAQVKDTLFDLNVKKDSKPFSPHITLARLKTRKTTPDHTAFLDDNADFHLPPFDVDRFILYRSTLTPQGSVYEHVGVYPLRGSAE